MRNWDLRAELEFGPGSGNKPARGKLIEQRFIVMYGGIAAQLGAFCHDAAVEDAISGERELRVGRINNSSPWVLPFDSDGGVRFQAEVLEAHWIRVLVVYGAENGRWCRAIDLECGVGHNRERFGAGEFNVIRDVEHDIASDDDIVTQGTHFIIAIG